MKKRAKPGGAATFLAHPRRPSRAPCQPPRSLLSPRRRSRPTSPKKPHLPPPPPIRAADRRRRTADPYRIERIKANSRPGSGGSDPAPFLFFPTSRPSSIAPPALDRPCAPPALSLSNPFFQALGAFVLRRAPKQTGRRCFVKLRKGKERGAARFVAPA